MEKVVHKDAKIRTFIQEDSNREKLTSHAYDVHYGTIRRGEDVVVALDDSIVRGNTLKNAILRTLDSMGPTRIVMLSSCPQIRYPDVYGIDMAKMGDLAAFKAAVALLKERKMEHVLEEVYNACKAELENPLKGPALVNHVKRIYASFTPEEISKRIAEDVKPKGCGASVEILFQTVEDLHKAMPDYAGDWYFTGDYPTQGGTKVCCRAFVLWMEGSTERCYGVSSALSRAKKPVLVLGSGGREHALAWKLRESAEVSCVYVAPGNGGIGAPDAKNSKMVAGSAPLVPVNLRMLKPDFSEVVSFCKEQCIWLVVIGPEQPLADGISDQLRAHGIRVFGPSRAAAEIESSKVFAKSFMSRHKIPTAEFKEFKGAESIDEALSYVNSAPFDVVVKASGLAAGKGVIVPESKQEAVEAVQDCLQNGVHGSAGAEIVIERRLHGVECSVLALTDGTRFAVLPAAQDHKRAFDGDKGLNTGGMGAFAPTPAVDADMMKRIEEEILRPTIDGLRAEGKPFVGCLFAGLMLTSEGPQVIEFNCRFGDPETQVVLPLIDCNLTDVLSSCVDGCLAADSVKILSHMSAVSVVMASGGYPGPYKTGHVIAGIERASCVPGVNVFHAGTRPKELLANGSDASPSLRHSAASQLRRSATFGSGSVTTAGGRVLAVTAIGATINQARDRAYAAVRQIQFTDGFYRKDIAANVVSISTPEPPMRALPSPAFGPTYLAAGVDVQMEEAISSTMVPLMQGTRGFALPTSKASANKSVSDADVSMNPTIDDCNIAGLAGYTDLPDVDGPQSVMVSSANGVGTKLKVAMCMERFDSVGTDLVALCANDVAARGAAPVFFSHHLSSPKLDAQQAVQIAQGVSAACVESQCTLLNAKTAEMPGTFTAGGFDLVGFAVGVGRRADMLPKRENMEVGDVLIGLQSSGLHSNGFSLVRSVAKSAGVRYHAASAFDPTKTFGEIILTPTRVYVKPLLALAKAGKLKGAAPITNGGLFRSIPRVLPSDLQAQVRCDTWDLPAVFRWIGVSFKVSCREMAATFNCGIGMVLVVAKQDVDAVLTLLRDFHEEPKIIGELGKRSEGRDAVHFEGAESSWLMMPELGVSLPFPVVLSSLQDPWVVSRHRLFILGGSSAVTSLPLQALIEAAEVPAYPAEVVAVASTHPKTSLLEQARAMGISNNVVNLEPRAGSGRTTDELEALLQKAKADIFVVLDDVDVALLGADFRRRWDGKLLTVHASLQASSGNSVDPVQASLDAGMCVSGCTILNHVLGTEARQVIFSQETTRVMPTDNRTTLHKRIVVECECPTLKDAVREIASEGSGAGIYEQNSPEPRRKRDAFNMKRMVPETPPTAQSNPEKRPRLDGDAAKYSMRGVSADKGDVHAAIKNIDKGVFPKAFCKIVPDSITNNPDSCVVMHADGAGTKSSLAYMYWKKTGDLSVWKGIAQDALVMNLDDLLCVGVTDNIFLSSTIGRNKNVIPGEVIQAVIAGTEELVRELKQHGVGITSTGGETADVGDLVRTIIVDSTVFARIPRSQVIDNSRIQAGDVIVGLSSSGQSTYETTWNSGIGSNGLTSARHDTFENSLAKEFPESFDPSMPSVLVYSGKHRLEDPLDATSGGKGLEDVGKLVLSPTRTYAPIVRQMLQRGLGGNGGKIHGMVHCSGGGQTKVLHFVEGVHVVKDNMLPIPPVFRQIHESSGTSWEEMYKVFNMGHRLEVYTDAQTAQQVIDISKSFNVDAQVIGHVKAAPGKKSLTIMSEHAQRGFFEYSQP
jgi:phosphoribosylamine--glycine ligase/phosphoribosylaminoimidazole synthetase